MKTVIPVAGFGARLPPHAFAQPKALLRVAGKPILGHILDELVTEWTRSSWSSATEEQAEVCSIPPGIA